MARFKTILIGAITIAGVAASLAIRHTARIKLRENDTALAQLDHRLVELMAQYQRLSNLVAQANNPTAGDRTVEGLRLRAEAEALRKQTNELGKQLAENRRSSAAQTASRQDASSVSPGAFSVVSDSNSEEYAIQLYKIAAGKGNRKTGDARNLGSAVRKYAREHQGEFPSNLEDAAVYFYEDQEPPQTSEFEMIYQGSLKELTNVPQQGVALIRQRQAWPTPLGKWARIYVMAGGDLNVVESDDNFQSWEASHIIPPPGPNQK